MAWIKILPGFESLLRKAGCESAASFLDWTGVLVNKHRHREVEQVRIEPDAQARDAAPSLACASGSESFFLKKEHAVSWRDRVRNAWHGFGRCSTAVREAAILQALRAAGIGCPEVAAFGEDGRHAFVLLRDQSDMTELRTYLQKCSPNERKRVATALGRELARMHAAGFQHPDLFAKHILVGQERFCILDWQRGRRRRAVSWRLRCRDLAALDATLHDGLANDRLRLRCLRAYAKAAPNAPPLGRFALQIRTVARGLREDRNIREAGQLPVPAGDQQFVQACDGRLLVVRTFYERHNGRLPDWLMGETDAKFAHAAWSEKLSLQTWPRSGSTWEIPPLAHTLFRLQRFGIPAPRLCAVGCGATRVYLLAESLTTIRFEEALAKATLAVRARMLQQAGQIVRRIHEAGYSLPANDSWSRRLGVDRGRGDVVLAWVDLLRRDTAPWTERGPTELNGQKIRLTRSDQLRFLHGYLQRRPKKIAGERQVT
jgi:tRNA A-37 threonylcarbamoyl transferase component Bud32